MEQSFNCWNCGTVTRYRDTQPVEARISPKRQPCSVCAGIISTLPLTLASTPIQDAINKIDAESFTVEAGVENGDAGVRVEFNKTFKESWQAGLLAEWFKDKGYKAMGYLRWRGNR